MTVDKTHISFGHFCIIPNILECHLFLISYSPQYPRLYITYVTTCVIFSSLEELDLLLDDMLRDGYRKFDLSNGSWWLDES